MHNSDKCDEIYGLAQLLWEFHLQRDELHSCDAIFVLGSNDFDVPRYAIELYKDGFAPLLIFSGGVGNFTAGVFERAEADLFADIARASGVPEDALVLENTSTNSGENIQFTKNLLKERGITLQSLIAVQKPFMGKRVQATLAKQWPEVEALVTSAAANFVDYRGGHASTDEIIHVMVGDLHRLLTYPKLGFQIEIPIPAEVRAAYQHLRDYGFTGHL